MSSRWVSKPPVGSQINWGHPLSQGLVGAWLMNEGGGKFIDLISLKLNVSQTAITRISSTKGSAIDCGTSGKIAYETTLGSKWNNLANTGVSVVSLVFTDTFDATSRRIVGKRYSTPTSGWSVGTWNSSGNKYFFEYTASTNGSWSVPSIGGWEQVSWSYKGLLSGVAPVGYVNGKVGALTTTSTGIAPYTDDTAAPVTLVNHGDIDRPFDGKVVYIYVFSRALSPSEIQSLYESPYQFIKGPSTITYFTPPAAGGWVWGGEVKNVMVA